MASGASFRKDDPVSLQRDNLSSVSLSSITTNCQQLLRFEEGDMRAAFSRVTTSSCVNSSDVNLRMLRRCFINSLKLFIKYLFFVRQI